MTAQSPFLEGTKVQFAWDSMTLGAAMECPRRYQYWVLEGWQYKAPSTAIALVFGILLHKGVEQWHRHDGDDEAALKDVMEYGENGQPLYGTLPTEEEFQEQKEAKRDDEEDDGMDLRNARVRTRYHLIRALVWYFEHYRKDNCKVIRFDDGTPAVEVSFRVPVGATLSGGQELILAGHMDQVVQFGSQTYVSDIKSTKSITSSWRRLFDLSHQMTGYALGGKLALERPVAGVMIDGIALQVGGVKFARHFTDRTPSQFGEFVHHFEILARQYEQYHDMNYYPMNTTFCRFCEYKDVCAQPPELREGYLNHLYRKVEAWNPLKSR